MWNKRIRLLLDCAKKGRERYMDFGNREYQMISIIVPVYNLEKTIVRCVNSIKAQTYQNLEIILVDDGSTDQSSQIIKQLAETDDRVITLFQENNGVTSARLTGCRAATGDYIGFVDGDDEIEPDMFEILIKKALQHHADISHCGYQMRFPDGRIHYFYNTECIIEQDTVKGVQDLLEGAIVEPGLCNKLYHKHLIHRLLQENTMDSTIKFNEDLLMNYYLFKYANQSVFYDVCKYHYIIRNDSASKTRLNRKKLFDPIHVKQIILEDCEENLKQAAERALLVTCVYSYCSLLMEPDHRKQWEDEVSAMIRQHNKGIRFLPRRTHILAWMIEHTPKLLAALYPIYVRFFQKGKYS